jgi:hypothetical protein
MRGREEYRIPESVSLVMDGNGPAGKQPERIVSL